MGTLGRGLLDVQPLRPTARRRDDVSGEDYAANKAYFLYLRQPAAEKAKLLRMVLSNCKIAAASVEPTYRKPFDLIFQRVKKEE
jgi:hypothetical protein